MTRTHGHGGKETREVKTSVPDVCAPPSSGMRARYRARCASCRPSTSNVSVGQAKSESAKRKPSQGDTARNQKRPKRKLRFETVIPPPKPILRRSTVNPNSTDRQYQLQLSHPKLAPPPTLSKRKNGSPGLTDCAQFGEPCFFLTPQFRQLQSTQGSQKNSY